MQIIVIMLLQQKFLKQEKSAYFYEQIFLIKA